MKPIKIGFVLLSNSRNPLPSTRIAALNMVPFLRAAGFEPHVIYEPSSCDESPEIPDLAERLQADGYRLVYFQKVSGPHVVRFARGLARRDIRTIFAVCDLLACAMVEATDATFAVTHYLRSLYPPELQEKIHVVHDGIENPEACKTQWRDDGGSRARPLRAILVTSSNLSTLPLIGPPPAWLEVCIVGNYPPQTRYMRRVKEARWQLAGRDRQEQLDYVRFLLNPRIARIPWDPQDVYRRLVGADIGVIPIVAEAEQAGAVPSWKVKSENRLTMKMSAGLPVIATPIPSYEAVIEHGVNGFLARTKADWDRCLEALRDPGLRREMGECARRTVSARYSMQTQAQRFIDLCEQLLQRHPVDAAD